MIVFEFSLFSKECFPALIFKVKERHIRPSREQTSFCLEDGVAASIQAEVRCNIAVEELWFNCFAYYTVLPEGGMLQESRPYRATSTRTSIRKYGKKVVSSCKII
ncbi:uncharacterized protein LOC111377351 [Olea europaea var. sylvestris]|uniref:uncharacterized protein LOC111377351 n=1 Tax=Olea europaea var. sylvestris TaxID=158386 RepID=UPI000C1CE19B|nr:uncharacterized protein LOC111377351 [Olea europaea var. sylvestris]